MKLYEYEGTKVVTVENLEMYVTDPKSLETIKNNFPKWLKNIGLTYMKISSPDSKKYGQKKWFNYARGLCLFPIDNIMAVLDSNHNFLTKVFDIKTFKKDIAKGEVRALPKEITEKNWREQKQNLNSSKKTKSKTSIDKTSNKTSDKTEPIAPIDNSGLTETKNAAMQSTIAVDEVYAMIDRMSELYQNSNNELKEKIDELSNKVETLINELTELKNSNPVQTNEIDPSVLILKYDASYEEWKKGINKALDIILKAKPDWTKDSILSAAYKRLRSQYGIVWEQEAKEFKEEYGRGPVNTRELCWWMETNKPIYKNLLVGKLNTMYSEVKRGLA